jgi:hypothetical protein
MIEAHVEIWEEINLTSAFGAEQPRWAKTLMREAAKSNVSYADTEF